MTDLIVFSVGENKYAMSIDNVQRIIQASSLTNIPNAHDHIDGMMSYEDKVIKVLNFRKLIQMKTYEEELNNLFASLKVGHADWVNALKLSVETGVEFTKTLNPHACGLGKWIDSFTAYEDHVVTVLNKLIDFHSQLHLTGGIVLEEYAKNKEKAQEMFNEEIMSIYGHTMGALDTFTNELDIVADSLQKFIIYEKDGSVFAIKVDAIEDIAHVSEDQMANSQTDHDINDFLELEGVLDLDGILINIIKRVILPK